MTGEGGRSREDGSGDGGTVAEEFVDLVDGVLEGDQLSLSRLITGIENEAAGYETAMEALYPFTGSARIVGITGAPGAGKSTLVDGLVDTYRERELTVGVIAVDPSSPYSGGSVLGDRIRQTSRNEDPEVFFRSMSARGHSGGLAAATFDVVHAMDAFRKDIVIIETVGAGQSEVEIVRAADTVCVVAIPGAGDDVQATKAGILEIADVFAINKADLDGAKRTANNIEQMINIGESLASETEDGWRPPIVETSALHGEGIDTLIEALDDHSEFLEQTGELTTRRTQRFDQQVRVLAQARLERLLENRISIEGSGDDETPHEVVDRVVRPVRTNLPEEVGDE